jgi:hypothetical protein
LSITALFLTAAELKIKNEITAPIITKANSSHFDCLNIIDKID